MLHRLLFIILIISTALYLSASTGVSKEVLGAQSIDVDPAEEVEVNIPKTVYQPQIHTQTAFEQKEVEEYETIPYETEYIDDEDLEYGLEIVKQVGIEGVETSKYLVTYWVEDVIDKQLVATEVEPPTKEIISFGKKIIWNELNTPDLGTIKYWRKMNVFATKYDSTCIGCNNTTALGAPVKQGVCAVDPKVIDMYTHFYVPGYGKCQALDVGGLIKGNRIDLAYEDHRTAPWRTGYVDIYLMDNEPE